MDFSLVVSEEMRVAAIESDRCITEASTKLSKMSMEIGWEGAFLKKFSLWPVLGCINELEYRVKKGVSRSTWYETVGAAYTLRYPSYRQTGITKDQFLAMSLENAKQLAAVEEEVRYSPALLEKAATLTNPQFKHAIALDGAMRENRTLKDSYSNIQWRVSESQRQVIERALNDWQHEHHLDDPARALELLMVEYSNRPTFVGFIQEAIVRLTPTVTEAKTVEELKRLQVTFADHIREMGEILDMCRQEEDVA